MRRVLFALLAVGTLGAAVATTPAEASGGCGPYMHRTYWGACRPPGQWGWGPGYARPVYGPPVFFVGPRWGWGWGWRRHWY